MALPVSGLLRLRVPLRSCSVLPSAKPVCLGPCLARARSTTPSAPWRLMPTPAFAPLLLHSCSAGRSSQLARPVGAVRRSLSSSQSAASDIDAATSFSAISVVDQRIDGVRWRVFGTVPDHAGTPGTKKLRKKLSGPSVLSWCVSRAAITHSDRFRGTSTGVRGC